MSRIFVVSDNNLTVGTGNVLFALRTAADALTSGGNIALRRVEIGQSGTTTGEMVRAAISTRDTAGTLTMTSATPRPISPLGGPASGITGSTAPAGTAARVGTDSSADSGGAYVDIYPATFHNLNGWLWVPTPEERIEIPPATVVCVRLLASPTGTTGWTISVTFEELS
jgi:hypothetical protein